MGLYFNTDVIDLDSTITLEDGVTFTFWYVHLSDGDTWNRIAGAVDAYEMKLDPADNKMTNDLFLASGAKSNTACVQGVWMFYALTGKSGTGASRIYMNGELDLYEGGHTTGVSSPDYFSLGNRYGVTLTQCAGGILEDFRMYNRVLSDIEIRIIYDCAGTDSIFKGLVHRYKLCEGYHLQTLPATAGFIKDEPGNGSPVNGTKYNSGSIYYYGAKIKLRKELQV